MATEFSLNSMNIILITPAGPDFRSGNRNTAVRWAKWLRELGHRVTIQVVWDGKPADLMIALHARRSFDSIQRFHVTYPSRPLIVALTGTDLYRDIQTDPNAQSAMKWATRMIVLQEEGLSQLEDTLARKTRIIYQSSTVSKLWKPLQRSFTVTVIGHLREEKDPFRAAMALKHIPADLPIRVVQIGQSLSQAMTDQAKALALKDLRYRWLGELPHWKTMEWLARSNVMVNSSLMEGGANVICEALAIGVPVIASHISGNIGMLGKDYIGYFPPGDSNALAELLTRACRDESFSSQLVAQCHARQYLVQPNREKESLRQLVDEVAGD